MRRLAIALLLAARLSAQSDSALQVKLGSIADTATVEHVYCVEDTPSGLTHNYWALESTLEQTSGHGVIAVKCQDMMPQANAVWHNHVFVKSDVTPTAESTCYFTKTDQHTFLTYEVAPVAVVQVNSRVKCWWTREQVLWGWSNNLTPLPAMPEQSSWISRK